MAVLKGDSVCKYMVALSMYDTKPVYMLFIMACDKVGWARKEKKQVYD
jgi:hypothetical protein